MFKTSQLGRIINYLQKKDVIVTASDFQWIIRKWPFVWYSSWARLSERYKKGYLEKAWYKYAKKFTFLWWQETKRKIHYYKITQLWKDLFLK